MNRIGVFIFSTLLVVAQGIGVQLAAQEAEDAPVSEAQTEPAESNNEQNDEAQDNVEETPAEPAGETLDNFVPSEEVSSDLSVSFPVDI